MKRMISLAFMAFALLTAMAQSAGWSGGTGTISDPYRLGTVNELMTLAKTVNSGISYKGVHFQLTADVNFGYHAWTPIGIYGGNGFAGTFDGGGHKISGLYINNKDDAQGLFGFINGGTVKNVTVVGCDIMAKNYAGGIVGYNSGTVTSCIVENAKIKAVGTFCSVGGIAGSTYGGTVLSSQVSGSSLACSKSNVGGITGSIYNASIRDCSVASTSITGGSHMGGIVGSNDGGSVELRNNRYSSDVTGITGGCDGANINDVVNPNGAVPANLATAASNVSSVPVVTPMTSSATETTSTPISVADILATATDNRVTVQKSTNNYSTAAVATAGPQMALGNGPLNSSYIVKTKGVKIPETKAAPSMDGGNGAAKEEEQEATDFLGKNFRYVSMCDWQPGMRFMVIPEKYDMLVNTFRDANTNKEVSSGRLRHKIMVYKGHEDMPNGRVHVNFTCEDDSKNYYYQLPSGTFDDYCYGKLGVPTLAYLGDVDKARELLMDQILLTRTEFFREDTEYDGDGFKEVRYPKNRAVTVKSIGVGTRSFPVKIIVEDEEGNQFYQNVAMSKINSGMRDDEFSVDNEKFLFQGSFEFTGGEMAVAKDIKSYLNQTVHTKYSTSMSSKGAGKERDIKVPRFTGFIIDAITPVKDTHYYTLTLRETETRRIYYKDVAFKEEDVEGDKMETVREYYFGYLFGMGEGALRNTTLETRTAIREGRVIPGMSEDEVLMAVGEPYQKGANSDGAQEWLYKRSNGVLLVVQFKKGKVTKAAGRAATSTNAVAKKATTTVRRSRNDDGPRGGTWKTGTPLQ